jgi:hypothetical protein
VAIVAFVVILAWPTLRPFSVMNLKIRQYLSANSLLPAAKVFAQNVDITLSGFGSQPRLPSFEIMSNLWVIDPKITDGVRLLPVFANGY